MKLSKHFSLEEFTFSQTAIRHGFDNRPEPKIIDRLIIVASKMELVRLLFNEPIFISSGYRCSKLNALVNGSKHSAHMAGWAVDFKVKNYSVANTIEKIHNDEIFGKVDQLINEFGRWVHISFDPKERNQCFRIG